MPCSTLAILCAVFLSPVPSAAVREPLLSMVEAMVEADAEDKKGFKATTETAHKNKLGNLEEPEDEDVPDEPSSSEEGEDVPDGGTDEEDPEGEDVPDGLRIGNR